MAQTPLMKKITSYDLRIFSVSVQTLPVDRQVNNQLIVRYKYNSTISLGYGSDSLDDTDLII